VLTVSGQSFDDGQVEQARRATSITPPWHTTTSVASRAAEQLGQGRRGAQVEGGDGLPGKTVIAWSHDQSTRPWRAMNS
jgi:hypothetical protein